MPNLAAVLKQEIARLARREARSQMKGLRKASAQFRRDIARLKREASGLRSAVALLHRGGGKAAAPQTSETDSAKVRFTAKGVVSQRKRLGISAADYGKLVGVTGHTIYKWEHGGARPRRAQLSALASIRGLGRREALARLKPMGVPAPGKKRTTRR